MGKIILDSIEGSEPHENTLNEYDNAISEELLNHHLKQIASIYKKSEGYVCYVFGMGAHPKSTYTKLGDECGIDVVWFDSILPGVSKVLRFIIASYAGLIKILEPDKLPSVMKELSHMSMAGIYIFNQSMEQSFVDHVIKNPLLKEYDFGIKSDSSYFFYIVDADNEESSTGIYEIVSYGKKASNFADIF